MPADERIKVIFRTVFIKKNADWIGKGDYYFIASVAGKTVGNPERIFSSFAGGVIALPEAEWSTEVNVRNLKKVLVRFHGKDEEVFVDEDLGFIQHTLKFPFTQETFFFEHSTAYFTLYWEVQLSVGGAFGYHMPWEVFTTRQNTGSVTCTTVSGHVFQARMELMPS